MPPPEGAFQELGERELVATSYLRFVRGRFVDPGGRPFEREIVRHPGAVCVVPVEADGTVIMLRQFRAPVGGVILEIPAGKLDVAGEAREACARRELAEEVGRAAGRLRELGSFYNSPGFNDEWTTCYLAEELSRVEAAAQGIEEQFMTLEYVPISRVWGLVESGELVDAKSIIACALAARALRRRGAG
ncbi:MAG TPA: NUDIX hydrolase [Acidimicrobiales bacterium]|nr:NUDIX hydrolase [Acidimicrobiales bacterium]